MVRFESLTMRFESLNKPFNFGAFQANSKKAIWIPHIAIIHIPESSDWRRRFESTFQKVQTDEGDSNPSWKDSNPNSSKEIEVDRFESSIKRFESHMKKEEMLRAIDSNHLFSDSNPSWRTWRETQARIRIPYTAIRIPKTGVMKNKARRFESLSKSKGWKSDKAIRIFELRIRIPFGAKFKSSSCDSNLLHNDSNPFLRKIQISLRRFESLKQRFESLTLQKH